MYRYTAAITKVNKNAFYWLVKGVDGQVIAKGEVTSRYEDDALSMAFAEVNKYTHNGPAAVTLDLNNNGGYK